MRHQTDQQARQAAIKGFTDEERDAYDAMQELKQHPTYQLVMRGARDAFDFCSVRLSLASQTDPGLLDLQRELHFYARTQTFLDELIERLVNQSLERIFEGQSKNVAGTGKRSVTTVADRVAAEDL